MKRLVEFSDRHQLTLELAYYPPYHSKYNLIERCWGILENHWNGTLLTSDRDRVGMGQDDDMAWRRPDRPSAGPRLRDWRPHSPRASAPSPAAWNDRHCSRNGASSSAPITVDYFLRAALEEVPGAATPSRRESAADTPASASRSRIAPTTQFLHGRRRRRCLRPPRFGSRQPFRTSRNVMRPIIAASPIGPTGSPARKGNSVNNSRRLCV